MCFIFIILLEGESISETEIREIRGEPGCIVSLWSRRLGTKAVVHCITVFEKAVKGCYLVWQLRDIYKSSFSRILECKGYYT